MFLVMLVVFVYLSVVRPLADLLTNRAFPRKKIAFCQRSAGIKQCVAADPCFWGSPDKVKNGFA